MAELALGLTGPREHDRWTVIGSKHDLNDTLWDWLDGDETQGEWCWATWVTEADRSDSRIWWFAFSDPTTAMAFKMRFG